MRQAIGSVSLWIVAGALLAARVGSAQQAGEAVVQLEPSEGSATVVAQAVGKHQLRVDLEPGTATKPLLIRVELPQTGRDAWPAADVEVRDARGQAVLVRRSGIEWHKLLIPVPAVRSFWLVQAVDPPLIGPRPTSDQERHLFDESTGLRASLARWFDGRQAALSLRFDDSHPTHLTTAMPILDEYGFRGTFMINPGLDEPGRGRHSNYQTHRAEWEAVAAAGAHELANHTAHHRGATGDDEMDAEIGDAARTIWALRPGRSKLTALNLGGGTQWTTSRTLRYYLDKYHQFDASVGSLGMDDSYGNRVEAFREHLERHLASRGWCRVHFHYLGEGLSSSEANFRAALNLVAEHRESLWVAGMADIYKYQAEAGTASLELVESASRRLVFRLICRTDPELYDQPLTLEVTAPQSWPAERTAARDARGEAVSVRATKAGTQTVLRLDVAPRTAEYIIELAD